MKKSVLLKRSLVLIAFLAVLGFLFFQFLPMLIGLAGNVVFLAIILVVLGLVLYGINQFLWAIK